MNTSKELLDLLNLEKIEENLFRGQNYMAPWKRVFGGQVLSQALHAANQTVPDDRIVHSMHGYFILAGDINTPIIYEVDRIRDGGSFTTRRVVAIQKGRPIFNMAASFQKQRAGFDHQIKMPDVAAPEELISDYEWAKIFEDTAPDYYRQFTTPRPIEFRPVEKQDPINPINAEPFRNVWFKAKEKFDAPLRVHQEVLTYACDYNLLVTASLPHRSKMKGKNYFYASLDHAMWFHRAFRVDEWLLYAIDSPSASNSRGFTRGNIFTKDGILVASVVQEGLMAEYKK